MTYVLTPPSLRYHLLIRYGPLVKDKSLQVEWSTIDDLARTVEREDVSSVIVDVFGPVGYLSELRTKAPSLGRKIKVRGVITSVQR